MKLSDSDRKWIDALRPYWGGGIVPVFRMPDGSVDAVKTIDRMMQSREQHKVGADGKDLPFEASPS
jgi:hypothetical protein